MLHNEQQKSLQYRLQHHWCVTTPNWSPLFRIPYLDSSLGWFCTTSAVVLGFLDIQPTPLPSFWSSSGPPAVVAHDCVPDCPGYRRQCLGSLLALPDT
jgi:hypothetical protein